MSAKLAISHSSLFIKKTLVNMKNLIIATAFLFLLAGLQSCQDGNSQTSGQGAVPEIVNQLPQLLDRNEKLRYGTEWDDVQNAFGKNRQQLIHDPNAKEPYLNLAYIYIQEARVTGEHPHYYPAALQVLDVMLAKEYDPKDIRDMDLKFRALSAKAGVELSLHDFATAKKTGEAAVAINPHNAAIYGALVDANVELGDYPTAVQMADKMVGIRPDLRSYSRVSYLREIHGDVPGAIEAMEMAVRAGVPGTEQTAWAMLTLGNLYHRYGKPDQAKMAFEAILAERPDYPFAMAALADLEIEKKNFGEAEKMLDEAVAIIPEVGFYESLAKIYQATGRTEAFEKTFQEILTMMQEDTDAGHNMTMEFAHAYLDLKNDPPKALEYAMMEYQKRPENIDVNGLLAEIYTRKGDTAKAAEHLEKALRTDSKNPEWVALK